MDPKEYDMEKRQSPIHGLGLFTLKDIPKGTKILPFIGEEMTYQQLKERYAHQGKDMLKGVYRRMPWQLQIVAKEERNLVSFVNDGCYNNPKPYRNVILKKGWLWAINDIKADEELLLDYGKKYWP